jgi:hypothetical protein
MLGFHATQGPNLYTSGFSTLWMLYMNNRVWTRAMPSGHGESRPNKQSVPFNLYWCCWLPRLSQPQALHQLAGTLHMQMTYIVLASGNDWHASPFFPHLVPILILVRSLKHRARCSDRTLTTVFSFIAAIPLTIWVERVGGTWTFQLSIAVT